MLETGNVVMEGNAQDMLADDKVKTALGSMQVQKVIVIPGRLVNIVAK